MAKFTRTLANGTGETLDVAGTAIMVKATVGTITVLPDNRNASREMTGGDKWTLSDPIKDPTFKSLHITNNYGASVTYTLEIFEAGHDQFESAGADVVVTTNSLIPTASTDGSVSVLVASTVLIVASSSTRLVSIQPQGGDIYIAKGAAATADSNSLLITDGSLYESSTTQAINAIRAGADNINTFWETQSA
jgi:hypothetical protein